MAIIRTLSKNIFILMLICVLATAFTACSKKPTTVFVDGAKIVLPEIDGYLLIGKDYPKFSKLMSILSKDGLSIIAVYVPDNQKEMLDKTGYAKDYAIVASIKGENNTSISTEEEFAQLKSLMLGQRELVMGAVSDSANNIVSEGNSALGTNVSSPKVRHLNNFADTATSIGYVILANAEMNRDGKKVEKSAISAAVYNVIEGRTMLISVNKVADQKDAAVIQSEAEKFISEFKNVNQFGFGKESK